MKKMKKFVALCVVIAVVMGLCSCGEKSEVAKNVCLKWYFIGDTSLEDNDKVYDLVSQKVREKLGFDLECIPVDLAGYNQKMQMIMSGGEEYDLCWTSNWCNDYFTNVSNGAFIPIDDLLEEAPLLKESINEKIWDGVKREGKIYAVPNQQIMARSTCLLFPEVFYEKYKSTLDGVDSFEKLDAYMEAFGKDYPDKATVGIGWSNLVYSLGIDPVVGCAAVSLNGDEDDIKVFNMYDTDEWRSVTKARNEWTKKGYTITASQGSGSSDWKGKPEDIPVTVDCYKPGVEKEKEKAMNYPVKTIRISDAYLTLDGINATLTAISATSKHPKEAIKLLEYVNTDSEIMNILSYGIEGEHYNKVGKNTVKVVKNSKFKNDSWVFGNVFNSYIIDGSPEDTWIQTKKINDTAKESKLLGFSVDTTPIKLQLTNCNSVIEKYMSRLNGGFGDSEENNRLMNEELKVAGVDDVIAEVQRQIDEWKSNK